MFAIHLLWLECKKQKQKKVLNDFQTFPFGGFLETFMAAVGASSVSYRNTGCFFAKIKMGSSLCFIFFHVLFSV